MLLTRNVVCSKYLDVDATMSTNSNSERNCTSVALDEGSPEADPLERQCKACHGNLAGVLAASAEVPASHDVFSVQCIA